MVAIDFVRERLESRTGRSKPLNPEMKVFITLRYLTSGRMELCSSDDFRINQPTVNRVITQILKTLTEPIIFLQFVKFLLTLGKVQRKHT